jgi:hypothetical protein
MKIKKKQRKRRKKMTIRKKKEESEEYVQNFNNIRTWKKFDSYSIIICCSDIIFCLFL